MIDTKPEIKFSHNYLKLWKQKTAMLLAVFKIDEPSEELKEYDTSWHDDVDSGYYPLLEGNKIQLIFLGDKGIPFCTIRRFTEEKYTYYLDKRGQNFNIKITTEKN